MLGYIGDKTDKLTDEYGSIGQMDDYRLEMIRLSDYNALMKLYGGKALELNDDEYAICATFSGFVSIYEMLLEDNPVINVFGNELVPHSQKTIYSYVRPSMQPINVGVFIVPDGAVEESGAGVNIVVGNYSANDKKELAEAEKIMLSKNQ